MEERRNGKVLAVVALLVAVAGLSLGYAALSTTLTINGSASVTASSWSVKFANKSNGTAANSLGYPSTAAFGSFTLSDTVINGMTATLKTPGDHVSYKFEVLNTGSYNAKISTITGLSGTPTCAGTGANATTDASNVCSYIHYTLNYAADDAIAPSTAVAQNNPVAKTNGVRKMELTISYVNSTENATFTASKLPLQPVTVTLPAIAITYVQA